MVALLASRGKTKSAKGCPHSLCLGSALGYVSIQNRWAELRQHGLSLRHRFPSVYFHLFGRNQFLPSLYFPPRKPLCCLLSCHFHLLYCALSCSVINFPLLGFWVKVFSYCLCFACGSGIIDLCGLNPGLRSCIAWFTSFYYLNSQDALF